MKLGKWAVLLGPIWCLTALGDYESFINQKEWPTLQEYLREKKSDNSRFSWELKYGKAESFVANPTWSIDFCGAQIIAELEYAFPGAAWVAVGRDARATSDVLEAFSYGSYSDRVIRINASSATFDQPENYARVLKEADLLDEKGLPKRKFVLFDPTRWRTDSQMRRLLEAAYQNIPADQIKRYRRAVGAVSLGSIPGFEGVTVPISSDEGQSYFDDMAVNSDRLPNRVLRTCGELAYLRIDPDAGTEVAWHGSFGPLRFNERWFAEPGKSGSRTDRQSILQWFDQVLSRVSSPSFFRSVRKKAEELGYDFEEQWERYQNLDTIEKEFFQDPELFVDRYVNSQAIVGDWMLIRDFLVNHADHLAEARLPSKKLIRTVRVLELDLRDSFFHDLLYHERDLSKVIELFEMAKRENLGISIEKIVSQFRARILRASPSLIQMKQLLLLIDSSSTVYQDLVLDFLPMISTRKELRQLRLPQKSEQSNLLVERLAQWRIDHPLKKSGKIKVQKKKKTKKAIESQKGEL